MLWLWPLLLVLGALVLVTRPQSVQGFIAGAPVTLAVVSVGDGATLEVSAAAAFFAMKAACLVECGQDCRPSGPNAGFRTSEVQASLGASLGRYGEGGVAAAVGLSPHQGGKALDILGLNPNAETFNPTLRTWLLENCRRFGWVNAGDSYKQTLEPWHYEFRGGEA